MSDTASATTVSGRRELIERDDGPGEEPVYLSRRRETITYHDDADCRYLHQLASGVREWTRRQAQRRDKAPCKECVGLGEVANETDAPRRRAALQTSDDSVFLIVAETESVRRVYHEDRECRHLARGFNPVREGTRREEQRRGTPPCKRCALQTVGTDSGEEMSTTCPFCDSKVRMLPAHLPCDGANADTGAEAGGEHR